MLFLPAGRWQEVDEIVGAAGEVALTTATSRLVWLGLHGGMAMRRGDLQTAEPLVDELRPKALASGEAQRIVPMASVAVPWLVVTERTEELESLMDEMLTILDGQWPSVLTAVPVVRALAAAGAEELLERTLESMRLTPSETQTAMLEISLTAGEALLALQQGRTDDAVQGLSAAVEAERKLGYDYDAACLELDLARALEAHGDRDAAERRAEPRCFGAGTDRRRERVLGSLMPIDQVNTLVRGRSRRNRGPVADGPSVLTVIKKVS